MVPFTIAVVLTVVYLCIYRYDRCLLMQDGWCLTIYAAAYNTDRDAYAGSMREHVGDIEKEHYVAWEQEGWDISAEHGKAKLSTQGSLVFPSTGWNLFADSDVWNISFEESVRSYSMRNTLRLYNTVEEIIK